MENEKKKVGSASFISRYQNATEFRVPSGKVTVLDSGAVYPSHLGTEIDSEDLQALNLYYKRKREEVVEEFGENVVREELPDGPRKFARSDVLTMANGQKRQKREWEDRR